MPDPQYLSTDPNAGTAASGDYLSTDPHAGEAVQAKPKALPDHPNPAVGGLPGTMIGNAILRIAKNHPGTVGAMTASLAAAPFTSGLSIPAAMLAEGGISAVGALAGHGAKAALTGEGSMSDALSDAAWQGTFGAAGPAVGGALRFAGNALRGAKPAAENVGGRLVRGASKGGSVEDEMAAAIADARKPTLPDRVSLPPPQKQPPVSYPRQAPVKIAKPQAPPQARSAPTKAPSTKLPADQLPESWKPFAGEVPSSAPKPQLAPRASDAPLGLSDDAPMWSSGQSGATEAGDWRRALGADEAGALLGKSADDVRALSGGGPHRRPMVAELADLDRDYLRQINNPRGKVDLKLLLRLGNTLSGGLGGGALFGPVGAVAGVAAANPKQTGRVMYEAGKLPMADMVRAAFLAAMSADDDQ